MKLKIIFFGTPRFGAIVLEKLAQSNYKPVLVITEPDKPVGRKQELKSSECKIIAGKYNIPVEQPESIKNLKLEIRNWQPDLIIVAAYGQILPKEIIEIPKSGCLNVHPSLLPKYRGPSPIQTAILNRDKETGVTIILMDELIDHGSIISDFQFPISNDIYYEELEKELAEKGAKLLIEAIPDWITRKIKAIPQDNSKATFTKIIKKEDGKIDWKKPAEEIEAQVRAFHIWPGTFTFWQEKRTKILKADIKELPNDQNYATGKVVASSVNEILVVCGNNFLVIKELQMEGKKLMKIREFLKGHPEFIGSVLK